MDSSRSAFTAAPGTPALRASLRAALLACIITAGACAPYPGIDNHLGVLPPAPPKPLWLGAMRPPVDSALRGSAAVTQSATPHWSLVLVSIAGARPSTEYTWALHSGHCADNGAAVGPSDRYAPLVAFPDGTATSETVVPATLTPTAAYSVHVAPITPTAPGANVPSAACADLAYGSM